MITVMLKNFNMFDENFELSQGLYDDCLSQFDINSLSCSCSQSHCLHKHGYYLRKIRTSHGLINLKILRVKCACCGRTHAIMLSCIIPFSQFLLNQMLKMIKTPISALNYFLITFNIDDSHVRYIKKMFHFHWKECLDNFNSSFNEHLSSFCFRHFQCQFMQIRALSNIAFYL